MFKYNNFYLVPITKEMKNFTLINSHSYFKSPRIEHSVGGIDLPTGIDISSYSILGRLSVISEWEEFFEISSKEIKTFVETLPKKSEDWLIIKRNIF